MVVSFRKLTHPLHQLTPFSARISFMKVCRFNIYFPVKVGTFFSTVFYPIDVITMSYRTSISENVSNQSFYFHSQIINNNLNAYFTDTPRNGDMLQKLPFPNKYFRFNQDIISNLINNILRQCFSHTTNPKVTIFGSKT